jgi:hypothetical protein
MKLQESKSDMQEHARRIRKIIRIRDDLNQNTNTSIVYNNSNTRRGCPWEKLMIFSKNITHEQQIKRKMIAQQSLQISFITLTYSFMKM